VAGIGTKIRIEGKKSGLTREQLAKKVGISAITLQRVGDLWRAEEGQKDGSA